MKRDEIIENINVLSNVVSVNTAILNVDSGMASVPCRKNARVVIDKANEKLSILIDKLELDDKG